MAKEAPRLLVTGSIAKDSIYVVPGQLGDHLKGRSGKTISVSMLAREQHSRRGGTGANIAYSLAMLGEQPILIGSVGKEDSEYILYLNKLGVDTRNIHFSNLPTASFTVFTDADNNQIGAFNGGAMGDSKKLNLIGFNAQSVFVIIAPHDPAQMYVQLQQCHKNRLHMCFDIGQQVINTDLKLLQLGLQITEVLILNDFEIDKLAERLGTTVAKIKAAVPLCITTKGKDGSVIEGSTVSGTIAVPAAPVTQVIDPTGAGDAYRAGFFAGYRRGMPLPICGKMGSVAAAYAVERIGGQEHSFNKQSFLQRYRQSFPQDRINF